MLEQGSNREMPPPKEGAEKPKEFNKKPIKESSGKINVVATMAGFYKNVRRSAGDIFTIENEKQFSKVWMQKINE